MHEFTPYRAEKHFGQFSVVYGRQPSGRLRESTSTTAPNSFDMAFLPHKRSIVRRANGAIEERSFLIGQGGMHGLEPIEFIEVETPSEYMEIQLADSLLEEVASSLNAHGSIVLRERHDIIDPVMWSVCARFRAGFLEGWPLDSIEAESIMLMLTSHFAVSHLGLKQPRSTQLRLELKKVRTVNDFIEANIKQAISIKQLAKLVSQSSYQFIRSFKASTGLTPYEFVLCKRVEHARRCILLGEKSIADAAYSAGCKNTVHFRKAFRRYIGINPSLLLNSI